MAVNPMVVWLWTGGGVMALGTAIALVPGRRRRDFSDPDGGDVPESLVSDRSNGRASVSA